VKRYDVDLLDGPNGSVIGKMVEVPEGPWVLMSDLAAAKARIRDLEAKLESVGEILAWIYGMGTATVEECKKGMRWPWAWEAEKGLQIIDKMACDYRVPSDFNGSAYWQSDRELAVTHRRYQSETKAEFPDPPQCSFCGRTEPEHLKLNHGFMVGGFASETEGK
jgi:hypothetical protein